MSKKGSLTSKDRYLKKLLVEGTDDANACYHLLTSHRIVVKDRDTKRANNNGIEIVDTKGIENLLGDLPRQIRVDSRLASLGIVVDADEDIVVRWQSLRDILLKAGYLTAPASPDLEGTIIYESDQPTIGIWIMPNNELPGMLEHFCRFLVPYDDCLWDHAESIVQQVMQVDCRFPDPHLMKAQIHSWLAWQNEPGKPLGQAITKKFLDAQAPYARQFILWICRLFELNSKQYV
jgi:hypothetical protein